jgi:hypothetical protein
VRVLAAALAWADIRAVEISRSVDDTFLIFTSAGEKAKTECKVSTKDCDFASLRNALRDLTERRSVAFHSP